VGSRFGAAFYDSGAERFVEERESDFAAYGTL
jgi:hypothetical protein